MFLVSLSLVSRSISANLAVRMVRETSQIMREQYSSRRLFVDEYDDATVRDVADACEPESAALHTCAERHHLLGDEDDDSSSEKVDGDLSDVCYLLEELVWKDSKTPCEDLLKFSIDYFADDATLLKRLQPCKGFIFDLGDCVFQEYCPFQKLECEHHKTPSLSKKKNSDESGAKWWLPMVIILCILVSFGILVKAYEYRRFLADLAATAVDKMTAPSSMNAEMRVRNSTVSSTTTNSLIPDDVTYTRMPNDDGDDARKTMGAA